MRKFDAWAYNIQKKYGKYGAIFVEKQMIWWKDNAGHTILYNVVCVVGTNLAISGGIPNENADVALAEFEMNMATFINSLRPLTDYENDTPLGQQYGDGFDDGNQNDV